MVWYRRFYKILWVYRLCRVICHSPFGLMLVLFYFYLWVLLFVHCVLFLTFLVCCLVIPFGCLGSFFAYYIIFGILLEFLGWLLEFYFVCFGVVLFVSCLFLFLYLIKIFICKIPNSKSWLHCNDAAALWTNENKVNNTSSYIYFYKSH